MMDKSFKAMSSYHYFIYMYTQILYLCDTKYVIFGIGNFYDHSTKYTTRRELGVANVFKYYWPDLMISYLDLDMGPEWHGW